MSMYETVDYYRTVLEMMGYTIRGNRVILISADGEEEEIVDGKVLVLPDEDFLRNPKWDSELPFHPLCENPARGESEVVKMILGAVIANLNVSLLGVMVHLYTNVASLPDTKGLSTEQSELLSYVTNITPKVKTAILRMVQTVDCEDQSSSLMTCNLRRRCPLGDTKYERVCVIRFPFAEMDRKEKPYGLVSVAEMDTVRGLLDYILPGWEVDDTYSVGTNSFVAPYFTSIMLMYSKIGSRLNEVINLFQDIAPLLRSYSAPGAEKVYELINRPGHMEKLRDAIPPLDGNKGSVDVKRGPATDYKIDQPKPAVDLPWEEQGQRQVDKVQAQVAAPLVDNDEGVPYVPGKVVPPTQPQIGVLGAPLGAAGLSYDPNSFHGRQMAKQALLQPLAMQNQSLSSGVGGSPFLESNEPAAGAYRPGALREAQQRQAQSAPRPLNTGNLGF